MAVAAAAGTAPASAQDGTYAYSVIGDYGNFEGTLWHFSDNSSEDTLSFNAEKQPVVTKGSKSTGNEATALNYRRVTLAAGDYQLSFSLKASSQAYYIVSGYGFDSAGNAEALKYEKTAEGSVGTEWTDVTANFTVNGSYTSVEFRIILRGAAGTQITVDKLETKAFEEKQEYACVPSSAGWDGTYKTESPLANSYIETSSEGYKEPGSLHFYQYGSSDRADRNIYYTLGGLAVGKTYTLKMAVKGDTRKIDWAVAMNIELAYSNNSIWAETNSNVLTITDNYSDWQELSYDFTANNDSTQIRFNTSQYGQIDCLIDDISVCEKGGTTNLIANSDFCKTEKVLINENLIKNDEVKLTDIPGIDMGMLRKDGASAAAVPGGSYDGSTALKVTADGLEGYFQTYGNESETDFPDAVKRGKIAFVKGDTAVKASGYFKKLDTSDAGAEPKVWFGFGKEYTVKKFLVSKTISSIGSHYNSESDRLDTEKYEAMDNGWVKFEMSLTDDMLASSELKTSLAEAERIRFMCGLDCDGDDGKKSYHGEALFDDVKFEIISKYAPGDSNGDGDIDIRDLVHMKKYAAGTVKFTDMTRGTWLSDIGYNESPSITNEMVCMRKYLIGASSKYGK